MQEACQPGRTGSATLAQNLQGQKKKKQRANTSRTSGNREVIQHTAVLHAKVDGSEITR